MTQRALALVKRRRGHVAFGKKIEAQAVADLASVDAVVLFLCGGDSAQHQRLRHLQSRGIRLEACRRRVPSKNIDKSTKKNAQKVRSVLSFRAYGWKNLMQNRSPNGRQTGKTTILTNLCRGFAAAH
jgi:hypothetical protein